MALVVRWWHTHFLCLIISDMAVMFSLAPNQSLGVIFFGRSQMHLITLALSHIYQVHREPNQAAEKCRIHADNASARNK